MVDVYTADEFAAGDELADYAERVWGWYLFGGIASILFGFIVLSFRFATILAVAIFIGVFFIGLGIVEIIGAFRASRHKWLYLLTGVLSVGAGIVTMAWPDITLFILAIFIGWTLLFWGVADIVYSLMFRKQMHYWWLLLIRGIISVALGVWAIAHPDLTLVVLVTVIGLWAVVWGVLEIIAAFYMRHARKHWDKEKAAALPG